MQAVIAYEHRHLPPEQHIGYIEPEPHTHCATDDGHDHTDEPLPLKWM
jgi:hypothetical protein